MLTHEFVDVHDIRLHCLAAGQGKLMLFLHGFPEFSYAWKEHLAEFGKDYHVVAPDLRGYNLSSRPAEPEQYRMNRLVGDLRGLIAHYTEKKCVLVAHDWGGAVAWSAAVAHPDLLEKLVIINSPHPAVFQREMRHNPLQQQASQYMLLLRSAEARQFDGQSGGVGAVCTRSDDRARAGWHALGDSRAAAGDKSADSGVCGAVILGSEIDESR
jgi:pimeloyl-ACP methyl ester carboxylesterase